MKKMIIILSIISLLLIVACAPTQVVEPSDEASKVALEVVEPEPEKPMPDTEVKVMEDMADRGEIQVTDDGILYIVDPSELRGGGPPKDGIPAIDIDTTTPTATIKPT